ncbi:hypothetical protein [Nostoc sp.]|uniref:hypothetical protein n=1 Tax=Nostoc sp. TaxID=1180 RepID=UPI002FFC4147
MIQRTRLRRGDRLFFSQFYFNTVQLSIYSCSLRRQSLMGSHLLHLGSLQVKQVAWKLPVRALLHRECVYVKKIDFDKEF